MSDSEQPQQQAEAAVAGGPVAQARRLPRAERREQILAAATQAFARTGFAATSLDDIAQQAGISRVILYRHFESKAELYLAVLDRTQRRLAAATRSPHFTAASVDALLAAAAEEPAGFRLLFRHAAREPEFRQQMDDLRAATFEVAHRHLAAQIPDPTWARWASSLVPAVVVEAVMAWLDAGQPDPADTAARINHVVQGIVDAARSTP